MNFQQYLKQVKSEIREVSVDEVSAEAPPVLIDVREGEEYNDGYIPGATWIPRGKLELRIEDAVPNRDADVVLYCAGGNRSALARQVAARARLHARLVDGGRLQRLEAGRPADDQKPFIFTQEQKSRYARHLMLPEVGEAGQAKLLNAKVLLLGAGGLGAPVGLYLAAAGVGTHRHRRRRRGRRVEPAAAGDPLDQARRHAQGRVGQADDQRAQPRRQGAHASAAADVGERARRHQGLRSHRRRHRQLPDPLPAQRRVADPEEAGGERVDLPVRGAGHGVQAVRGAVLPLPVSGAAAAGDGAVVQRGGRARRACRASSASCRRPRRSS